jgi:hypothetical protein
LNPQKMPAVSEHLAFNTAASFVTNTNWQSYGGESTMSYLSQMVALAIHNFFSAAVGIAIAAVVVRGIARHSAKTIGNFWVDLTRITYYLLLPICVVFAVALISQGMIQNFKPYDSASLSDPFTTQVPKVDDKGNPVVDRMASRSWWIRKSIPKPSCKARWPRKWRSRCSARMAAAIPMPTPRSLSRIPRRSRTSCRCSRSSRSRAR